MDYISINLFKNKQDSINVHILKSKLVKIPLTIFNDVDNFDPDRLQKSAVKSYPYE